MRSSKWEVWGLCEADCNADSATLVFAHIIRVTISRSGLRCAMFCMPYSYRWWSCLTRPALSPRKRRTPRSWRIWSTPSPDRRGVRSSGCNASCRRRKSGSGATREDVLVCRRTITPDPRAVLTPRLSMRRRPIARHRILDPPPLRRLPPQRRPLPLHSRRANPT